MPGQKFSNFKAIVSNMNRITTIILLLLSYVATSVATYATTGFENPKREFRGAWLHVIGQTQWQNKSTEQAKAYIREQLDKLHDAGCNAVIFQVRPTADALYKSELERRRPDLRGGECAVLP